MIFKLWYLDHFTFLVISQNVNGVSFVLMLRLNIADERQNFFILKVQSWLQHRFKIKFTLHFSALVSMVLNNSQSLEYESKLSNCKILGWRPVWSEDKDGVQSFKRPKLHFNSKFMWSLENLDFRMLNHCTGTPTILSHHLLCERMGCLRGAKIWSLVGKVKFDDSSTVAAWGLII